MAIDKIYVRIAQYGIGIQITIGCKTQVRHGPTGPIGPTRFLQLYRGLVRSFITALPAVPLPVTPYSETDAEVVGRSRTSIKRGCGHSQRIDIGEAIYDRTLSLSPKSKATRQHHARAARAFARSYNNTTPQTLVRQPGASTIEQHTPLYATRSRSGLRRTKNSGMRSSHTKQQRSKLARPA